MRTPADDTAILLLTPAAPAVESLPRRGPRARRSALLMAFSQIGPPGSGAGPSAPPGEGAAHTSGGLSGSEHEVEPPEADEAEPANPEEPPNTPLADEKRAITVYAARNLTNTIDTKPVGTAWFSA